MTKYSLPDLDYDYSALEPAYSSELLELHHGVHHAGYVDGINETLANLEEARSSEDFSSINALQKNLAFNLSGHVLHSLLWKNLSPDGGGEPDGELGAALEKHFGSTDAFRAQLTEAAKKLQGSGWAVLAWEPVGERLIVEQVYDHQGNSGAGTVPILVLDMWEHAYYLQYRTGKDDWIDAYWQMVDWSDVAGRYESLR